jgi:hypothetical protein
MQQGDAHLVNEIDARSINPPKLLTMLEGRNRIACDVLPWAAERDTGKEIP